MTDLLSRAATAMRSDFDRDDDPTMAETMNAVADLLEHWDQTFQSIGWPGPLAQATSPVFGIARAYLGEPL